MSLLSDIGDAFDGKAFFEAAGYAWNDILKMAGNILTVNPTSGKYSEAWSVVSRIYTTMDAIAVSLLVVFFLYGFCRDCCDLHSDVTFQKTIKLFIRLIITTNVMSLALSWMPKFLGWGASLTNTILGGKYKMYSFDGAKVYDNITEGGLGVITAFFLSSMFFLFSVVCAFTIVLTVINRMLKIYMIAPFAGVALSTMAAGGQVANVGFSYIRTFFGYVLSALLIAVVMVISSSFIDTFTITTDSSVVKLLTYCIKMAGIAGAVKMSDSVMQKAFNL